MVFLLMIDLYLTFYTITSMNTFKLGNGVLNFANAKHCTAWIIFPPFFLTNLFSI